MAEKRFRIKSQDDYFGITDNNVEDKMNVINGIHTEIEAKWLCDLLNEQHEEKEYWKEKYKQELEKNSIMTIAYDKQGNAHILPKRVD